MAPDLESAEHAAYTDAFRASPDFCEVAEIGGGTCLAVRRLPDRLFNRVFGLESAGALDEIAAFYGDTEWWVSDSAGLGPELEQRGFVRDYGWMKFSRGVGPREAQSDLRVVRVDRAARTTSPRSSSAATGCRSGRRRSPPTSSGGRAGRATSRTTATRRRGPGRSSSTGAVGWLGFGATLP